MIGKLRRVISRRFSAEALSNRDLKINATVNRLSKEEPNLHSFLNSYLKFYHQDTINKPPLKGTDHLLMKSTQK